MPEDYTKFKIAEGKYWEVCMHKNQYYLGRVYLWAKRQDALDLMDMTPDEQKEFFDLGRKVRESLTSLFKPDLFNYAALSNDSRHLHVHLIPRYESPRNFLGLEFKDERWGKNYAPYDYDFRISDQAMMMIKIAITEEMKKHGIR